MMMATSTMLCAATGRRLLRDLLTGNFRPRPLGLCPYYSRLGIRHSRFVSNIVVKVPHMADSITEGTLKSIAKKPGEYTRADEEIASIETDKVDVSVNAPVSGVIVKYFVELESTVVVGADLCEIQPQEEKPESHQKSVATSSNVKPPLNDSKLDSNDTTEITTDVPLPPQKVKPASTESSNQSSLQPESTSTLCRREKMSAMRLRIAERLKESQNTAAALTTFNEVDMSELMALRKRAKDNVFEEHAVKLGYMSAFVKAVCYAYRHVPVVLARIDKKEIVHPSSVDISVAVATPKGLVTPVLRGCQSMSFVEVERSIAQVSAKARAGKITLDDLSGGVFTISNGGVFGSLFGTPIINTPQSAILGMHSIKERPVVVDGSIVIRPMMYVCLTYDHRLIDGREAVTFLAKIKEAIEDPSRMLIVH